MSQTAPSAQRMVTELKVTAHMMQLDRGVFCIFHTPGGPVPDPETGLPGVRVSRAPAVGPDMLDISTFNPDGWLGGEGSAALIRVSVDRAQVLVTIYQAANSQTEAPQLQVMRLGDAPAPVRAGAVPRPVAVAGQAVTGPAQPSPETAEVSAHVQRRGDVLTQLGEWMGERGSQSWIEGFAISPKHDITPADIEYQAVLGKGWLSPWSEGGQYCGSRGMALPILGLRVRLKGDAAERFDCQVTASFTDGTSIGPLDGDETAEAPSLAPLEAFRVEILPKGAGVGDIGEDEADEVPAAAAPKPRPAAAKPAARPEPVRPAAAKGSVPKLAPKGRR
jgi:hypothetical protein